MGTGAGCTGGEFAAIAPLDGAATDFTFPVATDPHLVPEEVVKPSGVAATGSPLDNGTGPSHVAATAQGADNDHTGSST